MFTYRNIAIATVVVFVLVVGYYVLKPKKVDVTPQKPVVTQQVAPAKKPAEPAKK
jgi:hypothetical protein